MFLPTGMFIDNALFTVTAPGLLPRGEHPKFNSGSMSDSRQTDLLVRELCRLDDIDTTKSEDPHPVQRGACISVRLRLGDTLKCVDNHKWIKWTGDIGNATSW